MKPLKRISPELIEQIQQELATKAVSPTPQRVRNEAYKEKKRQREASRRAERKALNLCTDCGKRKPEGQTRCGDCVQRHRLYWIRHVAKSAQRQATE